MDWDIAPLLSDPSAWAALITLIVLEVVLGIDNVIFISILASKLPADQQERYMKDLDQMTPARFEKGIAFIQNQLSKK